MRTLNFPKNQKRSFCINISIYFYAKYHYQFFDFFFKNVDFEIKVCYNIIKIKVRKNLKTRKDKNYDKTKNFKKQISVNYRG